MMRVRLKADGRIVKSSPTAAEKTVDHKDPAAFVRHVRARCGLTQAAFAEKIEVPIRNRAQLGAGQAQSAWAGPRLAQS